MNLAGQREEVISAGQEQLWHKGQGMRDGTFGHPASQLAALVNNGTQLWYLRNS